ncbi:MAG TPA: ATP-dependent DNA helicase RecQ [Kofleriaceae bacterium]|nr:ATP-dependent DNA helicase RecQ [Kofleriaceae bacterium]
MPPMSESADPIGRALREVFGFGHLRPGQREVIDDVLGGRPVVTVMPTGAGKSLCYQLPAVILGQSGGVSLVVSPLIALMKDQVDSLTARGVRATALTSAANAEEQREIIAGLRAGMYSVVYVAPERFRSPRFVEALYGIGGSLSLLAIDEAHCISEWGHDFRPDYRRLGDAVRTLAPPRLIALTATATPEVRQDIAEQLHMQAPRFHVRGFDRPNLRLSVERAGGAADKAVRLVERVRTRPGGTALVYAATRKNTEKYAQALSDAGMRVRIYHAGLADGDRARAQDEFMDGKLDAIVATNAFGMGVDKADIRVVVHGDLPRSPEAYYQEVGRGGRDGDPAECVLLFNHGDVRLQEFLIDASYPSAELLRGLWKALRGRPSTSAEVERLQLPGEPHASTLGTALRILVRHGLVGEVGGVFEAVQPGELPGEYPALDAAAMERRAEVERSKLRKMVDYVYQSSCRRLFMLEYFGDEERHDLPTCSGCDNCDGTGTAAPMSAEQVAHVRALLGLVAALSGRFGRTRLASIANGTDDDARLAELPERGCLRGESATYLRDLLRALEAPGFVETTRGDYPTIAITRLGRRIADGLEDPEGLTLLAPPSPRKRARKAAKPGKPGNSDESHEPLDADALERAERLRQLRTQLASEQGVPAYVVFTNRTLDELARRAPSSEPELLACVGIGPARAEQFGDAILAALRD